MFVVLLWIAQRATASKPFRLDDGLVVGRYYEGDGLGVNHSLLCRLIIGSCSRGIRTPARLKRTKELGPTKGTFWCCLRKRILGRTAGRELVPGSFRLAGETRLTLFLKRQPPGSWVR